MAFHGSNGRATMLDNCGGAIHVVVYVWSCAVNDNEVCMMISGYWKEAWVLDSEMTSEWHRIMTILALDCS